VGVVSTRLFLAADLGGTHMRAAAVDARGTILRREKRRTPTADATPTAFGDLLAELLPVGATSAVVGIPGRIDHRLGLCEHAPNLPPAWAPLLSEARLSDRLGVRVHIGNDADLAAVGEAAFGAGRGVEDMVYLAISTGIGAGVVLGGRLVRGRRSIGEVGRATLDYRAALDGGPWMFEALASGTALARVAGELGVPGDGAAIVAAMNAGEPRALEAWHRVVDAAKVGIANVAFAYSPERIVVGGGLGLVGEPLLAPVRAWLAEHGPPGMPAPIEVVNAQLGDDAGLAAAGAWGGFTGSPC
jgi:glucokinase